MKTISTIEDIRQSGRPMKTVSEDRLIAYIEEVENLYVKPVLTDALYNKILTEGINKEPYKTLYYGGEYNDKKNIYHQFMGLCAAISYYVYAQNIMSGDFQATRYGMVIKDNDYSQPLSDKNRSAAYNNALEIASCYLNDCVAYCVAKGLIDSAKRRTRGTGGVRIRKIG